MSKEIKFSSDARSNMVRGVRYPLQHCLVKKTLGPKGRNVVLEKSFSSPLITNDGVTTDKETELEDHFENIGAKLVSEVATKTNGYHPGDGTYDCKQSWPPSHHPWKESKTPQQVQIQSVFVVGLKQQLPQQLKRWKTTPSLLPIKKLSLKLQPYLLVLKKLVSTSQKQWKKL